jgi:hypothetical protein
MKDYNLRLRSTFVKQFNQSTAQEQKNTLETLLSILEEHPFGNPPKSYNHLAITSTGALK